MRLSINQMLIMWNELIIKIMTSQIDNTNYNGLLFRIIDGLIVGVFFF